MTVLSRLTSERAPFGTASARMRRVLYGGAALTGAVFTFLAYGSAAKQQSLIDPVWQGFFLIALTVIPLTMLACASWASWRLLENIGILFIAVYAVGIVTFPLATHGQIVPDERTPWIIGTLSGPVFAAPVIWPAIVAWIHLVVICSIAGVVRFAENGWRHVSLPIQDTLFNVSTTVIFVAIVIVTLDAGRRRDEAARKTAADGAATAAAEAQNVQRARAAALTHDDVISTLLAASRSTPASVHLIRGAAVRALEQLDALGDSEYALGPDLPVLDWIETQRQTVAGLSDDIRYIAPSTSSTLVVPRQVVQAMNEATAEAVRNSMRYASPDGREVTRVIKVTATANHLTVRIHDDGIGFDPLDLPQERFGIRFSIRERMTLVDGTADITSSLNMGTHVTLRWVVPDEL
jgi:Histidine kinase-like ATPase domain